MQRCRVEVSLIAVDIIRCVLISVCPVQCFDTPSIVPNQLFIMVPQLHSRHRSGDENFFNVQSILVARHIVPETTWRVGTGTGAGVRFTRYTGNMDVATFELEILLASFILVTENGSRCLMGEDTWNLVRAIPPRTTAFKIDTGGTAVGVKCS